MTTNKNELPHLRPLDFAEWCPACGLHASAWHTVHERMDARIWEIECPKCGEFLLFAKKLNSAIEELEFEMLLRQLGSKSEGEQ